MVLLTVRNQPSTGADLPNTFVTINRFSKTFDFKITVKLLTVPRRYRVIYFKLFLLKHFQT